jgi:uncharacterized membrane protein
MSQTQRSILFYSLLSFFGLLAAVLVAMLLAVVGTFALGADWMESRHIQDRVVWATMALTFIFWLPFNLWCRRQITCPVCGASLFQTLWRVNWDFGENRWASNLRTTCPRCAAQLP